MKTSPAMPIPAVIERTAMGIKPANGANYQKAVREWISTRFGQTALEDAQERIARVVEEACELACVWQLDLAHYGGLIWPTPGTLRLKRAVFCSAGA